MERGHSIKVLNHGYVTLIDWMGSDETIIEAARMSTGKSFEGWEKDKSLLDYLWRHRHTSPFEMCEISFEVMAPLFVIREWQRHRTQMFNEASARYSQMPDKHYVPTMDRIQKQSAQNNQGSAEPVHENLAKDIINDFVDQQGSIYSDYEDLINVHGVSKEIARINTPVSRYSKMRVKASLLNWLKFLNQRMRPNAQYEIRIFAEAVASILKELYSRTWRLFEDSDLYGVSMSQTEMNVLRDTIFLLTLGRKDWKEEFQNRAKHLGITGRKLDEFLNKLENGGREMLV